MRISGVMWRLMVFGLLMVTAWGQDANAKPLEDPCKYEVCIETDVAGADGEAAQAVAMDGGEELLLLGKGDTVEMCRDHPCWASYDDCADTYRLPLGVGAATYGETRNATVDANFDENYCGWGASAGDVDADDDLVLHWPGATVFDESLSDGGQAKFQIWVYQDALSYCGGSRTYKGGDSATCTTSVSRMSWQEAYGDGRSDCEGSFTDPAGCHMPDVILLHPASSTDAWYYYIMRTSVCDSDGSNCVNSDETGCFKIHWD